MLAQICLLCEDEKAAEHYYLRGSNILEDLTHINATWDFRVETLRKQLIASNLGLGDLYLTQKKFDLARNYYGRALSILPEPINENYLTYQYDIFYGLGIASMSEDKLLQAEIYFLTAIDSYDSPDCLYLLGLIKNSQGNNEKAREYLEQSLELDENLVPALIELGRVYKEEEKLNLARELWERALLLEPDNESIKEFLKEL